MDQSTESNISTDGSFDGGIDSLDQRKLAGSYEGEDDDDIEEEGESEDEEEEGDGSDYDEEITEDVTGDDDRGIFNNNQQTNAHEGIAPTNGGGGVVRRAVDPTDQLREDSDVEMDEDDDGDSEELSDDESDDDMDSGDDDEDDDEDGDDDEEEIPPVKLYDPNEYNHLAKEVSPEIQNLFSYILDFQATKIILEPKLLPFIPEYIPAVGELDPFLKPPRPDGREEVLGLHTLDEPCLELSNPTIVKKMVLMKRKKIIKKKERTSDSTTNLDFVDSIQIDEDEDYSRFEGKIQNWITEIETKLHKKKPTSKLNIDEENKKKYPDSETLMKPWDDRFDRMLESRQLPSASMDLSLEQYTRVILVLLDIPVVDNNIVQSVRLLFSLFGDFKKNSAFEEQELQKEEEVEGEDD